MNIIYKPDPNLVIKAEESITGPVIVTVNKFNEESAALFRIDIAKAQNTSQTIIPVLIDSYGGEVYSLTSMIDTIKSSEKPISTIAIGKACSCGAILLTCGSPGLRYATKNTTMLIHDNSGGSWGKIEDRKSDTKHGEAIQKWLYDTLDNNCGKKSGYFEKEIHDRAHADWYLTPEDCLKHGLIDQIGMPHFRVTTKLDIEFVK